VESVTYLLVGGGVTSATAAGAIRERDEMGTMMIVGDEAFAPYDRPPLSKKYVVRDDFTPEDISSKAEDFYERIGAVLNLGLRAERIDRKARQVHFSDGSIVAYEKLLLATGARPRRLQVPGAEGRSVCLLRTVEDAGQIRERVPEEGKALMVGAGYIGLEVAASLVDKGLEVAVVDPSDRVWSRFASAKVAGFLQREFEKRGVAFHLGDEVEEFTIGHEGPITATTRRGHRLEVDLAVVGIGVDLNVELAEGAGLEVVPGEGVAVDRHFRTSDPSIWAAGDIACFEDQAMGKSWHLEHFLNARWHGQCVGANMAGEAQAYDRVPYFFSDLFSDVHMILRGDPAAEGERYVLGNLEEGEFVEVAGDSDGKLRMGIAFSADEKSLDPIAENLERLIRMRHPARDVNLESLRASKN
jgi:3-phenylpropionate/trans-cinnamate dioxygenase ferredoxin reductase component